LPGGITPITGVGPDPWLTKAGALTPHRHELGDPNGLADAVAGIEGGSHGQAMIPAFGNLSRTVEEG
jgi:hypothetical protein